MFISVLVIWPLSLMRKPKAEVVPALGLQLGSFLRKMTQSVFVQEASWEASIVGGVSNTHVMDIGYCFFQFSLEVFLIEFSLYVLHISRIIVM